MRSRTLKLSLLGALLTAPAVAQDYGYQPSYYGHVAPVQYAGEPTPADPNGIAPVPEGASEYAQDGYSTCSDCGCDDCCGGCWQPRGYFVNLEYNMWWTKGRTIPPLVTTSPAGTAQAATGVLPAATILFGDEPVGRDIGNGGTIAFGKWLDREQTTAIGAKFRAFRADDGAFSGSSDGLSNLAVPFFDSLLVQENSYLVGFTPDGVTAASSGTITVDDRLDLLSTEVYGQFVILNEGGARVDMVGGYHTMRLDNSLFLETNLTSLDNTFISPVGTNIITQDTFEGRNEFHGGNLGFLTSLYFDRWFFTASGKMSVGNMRQTILIDGNSVITTPGPSVDVRDEGLFALGTNQGAYSRDRIAYIPEANLKLGYYVRPNIAVTMGYNFMYISNVVLGGDQIDRNLNLSQTGGGVLVGPATPQFLGFRETDFWAQGVNFGLEVTF